jgi:ribose transport system permease protein
MTASTGTDDHEDALAVRAVRQRPWISRWLRTSAAWVLLLDVALVILFGVLSEDHVFLSVENFQAIALGTTESLLLTLGLALLLGAGVFDLSLGANLVLSSVVGASVINTVIEQSAGAIPIPAAIGLGLLAAIAAGIAFGAVNGLIVAYLDVNSLIATLGTLGAGTGVALLFTNGGDITGLPTEIQTEFGLRNIGAIPLPALIACLVAIGLWALLRYTRFGMRTLAIGSSKTAAIRSGLNVKRHLLWLTMLAGALAGLAGFVDIARYSSTTASGHTQDGLAAITAAVIGGTALAGGRVNILGAVWGAILSVLLATGLIILGVAPFYQLILIGVVLVIAVAIDRIRSASAERTT